jgi:hypothetical protein
MTSMRVDVGNKRYVSLRIKSVATRGVHRRIFPSFRTTKSLFEWSIRMEQDNFCDYYWYPIGWSNDICIIYVSRFDTSSFPLFLPMWWLDEYSICAISVSRVNSYLMRQIFFINYSLHSILCVMFIVTILSCIEVFQSIKVIWSTIKLEEKLGNPFLITATCASSADKI